MRPLSPVDATFLRMESKRTPMHVGALLTFKLPNDAPPEFVQQLAEKMRTRSFMPEPFGFKLAGGVLSKISPAWVEAEVDIDYHLRHSALPYPGCERELGQLVERLHSHPLDLSRPLWECHLIEGLENSRFAIYFKAHHCAIDGMGAVGMVNKWLSDDPDSQDGSGPWMLGAKGEDNTTDKKTSLIQRLTKPAKSISKQAVGLKDLMVGLSKMAQGPDSGARMALTTPRSLFNKPVSQQRRLGTQMLELARIKAISKATKTTSNDVLLAVCGSAIRRYLQETSPVDESLLASVPMGLKRSAGKGGNAVAGFVVPLGTDLEDPLQRLQIIHRVTKRSKREILEMTPVAQQQLALLGLSPFVAGQMLGILPKIPPLFNFVVSNVVLSKGPLYLMGAELEAMYPVSFLFDGYAINITLVGYNDHVAIGFLGCREAVPSLQRLAVYTGDALTELEHRLSDQEQVKPTASKPKETPAESPAKTNAKKEEAIE
ncbi:hypothetical protein A9Q99_19080 [Gammaproteobacteria bacterium 45_16_T64]|nr:hypothetical protein A9Q99_19080 [Gammaproteobacteria bacterium 45_16_T64]